MPADHLAMKSFIIVKCNSTSLIAEEMLTEIYINGLVQDCSNSIVNALELLQYCTKPSIYHFKLSVLCPDAASLAGKVVFVF